MTMNTHTVTLVSVKPLRTYPVPMEWVDIDIDWKGLKKKNVEEEG